MKIWLDDRRDPPDDSWTHVKTVDEAVDALVTNWPDVDHISMDHDLGDHSNVDDTIHEATDGNPNEPQGDALPGQDEEQTGMDLVEWIIANPTFAPPRMNVHSFNPAGGQRMAGALRMAGFGAVTYDPVAKSLSPQDGDETTTYA